MALGLGVNESCCSLSNWPALITTAQETAQFQGPSSVVGNFTKGM